MKFKFLVIPFCMFLLFACKSGNTDQSDRASGTRVWNQRTASSGQLVADTIIYDVIIKNPVPEDEWTEECLKSLDKKKMIDLIFENIYSGRIKAVDYTTSKELQPQEIQSMENSPEFNRDKIGKLQFVESWFLNEDMTMVKKVEAVTLGYEFYDNEGNLFGYRPLFKVLYN